MRTHTILVDTSPRSDSYPHGDGPLVQSPAPLRGIRVSTLVRAGVLLLVVWGVWVMVVR